MLNLHTTGSETGPQFIVSVIVCTYNRANRLRRTVECLVNQEGVGDVQLWELLIVDNNSTDHTKEVADTFCASTTRTIRYIHEPRQGKSYALNTGISHSRGRVLAFTDDDVIVDKKWVAAVLEASTRYSHRAFGGQVIPLWPRVIPAWIQPIGPYASPIVGSAIGSHGRQRTDIGRYTGDMGVPAGANMFFRREVFEKYGGFRVDLGPTGEMHRPFDDTEMGQRLLRHEETILYYPNAVVYHPVEPHKLSREFLLKHFWNVGVTEALLQDRQLAGRIRFKMMSRRLISLLSTCAKYLWLSIVRGEPAARMHYKCTMYAKCACFYHLGRSR